jgi:PAS domain S-box-containing protein
VSDLPAEVPDRRSATSDVDRQLLATDLHVEATNRLMEALVESENRMRRRVELLSDAVIETDVDLALVFLNPAWEVLTGLPALECLGRGATDYFPGDCRDDGERVLADRTGEHRELATRIEHADGRTVHVNLTTSPISSGGVVAVLRDVTREHGYQEALSKLSVVASSTSNLVIITDALGLIDWVNPAFEERTRYSLDEVRGRTPGSFLQGPDTDLGAVDRIRSAIRERRSTSEELLNYTKTGEPYWISLNLTPVIDADGNVERFISVQDDTTERKRVERMKTQFVSTVSHELRTPLTAISGALGLLVGGVVGPLPEQATKLLEMAQKNSARLTLLIDDLLDMEKLMEGGLPIESEVQPLMPIIEAAISDNQTYAGNHSVRLVLAERCDGVHVDVDSLRLTQVMSNLLSNACKFAPKGTSVDVRVTDITDPDDAYAMVRISVRDAGPGITDSFRGDIFEKFSQADGSDARASGGTGLGLAISKELVERLGGCIWFESTEGQGATFVVDLPAFSADSGGR